MCGLAAILYGYLFQVEKLQINKKRRREKQGGKYHLHFYLFRFVCDFLIKHSKQFVGRLSRLSSCLGWFLVGDRIGDYGGA